MIIFRKLPNKIIHLIILSLWAVSCVTQVDQSTSKEPPSNETMVKIGASTLVDFHDFSNGKFRALFDDTMSPEVIADGLLWSEGPLWLGEQEGFLLFTDVPGNRLYKWSRATGTEVFLEPSGAPTNPKIFREPGANGLTLDALPQTILVANHGKRAITRLNINTKQTTIVIREMGGKAFNSPNDLVRAQDGSLYFTDPPYGLKELDNSPYKELKHNGVYRLAPDGTLHLLTKQFSRPNGIGLSPQEDKLYVANSDSKNPIIVEFPLANGNIDKQNASIIHNGIEDVRAGKLGLPDGMALDSKGRLYATAPGGVHVFTPEGKLLGIIDTKTANANCTIGENGKALYIAAHSRIIRIALR